MPIAVPPSSDIYRLQIGDEFDVFVLEDQSFNGRFQVRSSGDIIMPKVGRIAMLGLTLAETEMRIKEKLQANQIRLATVIVDPGMRGAQESGLTIRISGEVGRTGRTIIKPLGNAPVSAYQAIVDSGGFKPFANKRKAYILRNTTGGITRLEVNFDQIEDGVVEDPILIEGDCIVVPKKAFGL
jgi:protein involved in polysaccharide export with SLBB domain